MMTRAVRLGLLLVLVLAPGLAGQEEMILRGNQLYQEGTWDEALEAYLSVYESGYEAGGLHYNIGNTYFKLGDIPRAILFYERAARLMPGDPDVAANLELARSLTVDDIDPLPRFWLLQAWDWWVGLLPRGILIWLVAGSWLLTGTGVAGAILARPENFRSLARRTALVAGVVTLVFGANLAAREFGWTEEERAVVMAPELDAHSAPSEDPNLRVFSIHAGTTVRVDRRADEWAEIILPDGRVGWVRLEGLETV